MVLASLSLPIRLILSLLRSLFVAPSGFLLLVGCTLPCCQGKRWEFKPQKKEHACVFSGAQLKCESEINIRLLRYLPYDNDIYQSCLHNYAVTLRNANGYYREL